MSNDFVGLADYEGHFEELGETAADGHGQNFARQDRVDSLNKALSTDGSVGTSAGVLIPQSLETTLQVLSFKLEELKLWQRISKKPAYSTFEEYDYLEEYGSDELGFIAEGALPPEDDSIYGKDFGKVKFMGSTRSVTHPATLVRTIAGVQPLIDREDRNGTMQLLRVLETALFYGDDRINPLSIKGLYQQIDEKAPDNVIDLRGKPIDDVVLEDLDNNAFDRYSKIDAMYMEGRQKNNLSQLLFPDKRFPMPASSNRTNLGMVVDKYTGNNGTFDLEAHQFIRRGGPAPTTARDNAVAAPAGLTVTPGAPAAGENDLLTAGTFAYIVTATGVGGESLGSATVTASPAAGDINELEWTNVVGAVYYKIYRGDNGATPLFLVKVPRTKTATTKYRDTGKWLPGTSMAFALKMDAEEGLSWKQLAPLMKLPLAQINTSMRWSILLYGAMLLYQPMKNFCLINVGDAGITHKAALNRPRN